MNIYNKLEKIKKSNEKWLNRKSRKAIRSKAKATQKKRVYSPPVSMSELSEVIGDS